MYMWSSSGIVVRAVDCESNVYTDLGSNPLWAESLFQSLMMSRINNMFETMYICAVAVAQWLEGWSTGTDIKCRAGSKLEALVSVVFDSGIMHYNLMMFCKLYSQ